MPLSSEPELESTYVFTSISARNTNTGTWAFFSERQLEDFSQTHRNRLVSVPREYFRQNSKSTNSQNFSFIIKVWVCWNILTISLQPYRLLNSLLEISVDLFDRCHLCSVLCFLPIYFRERRSQQKVFIQRPTRCAYGRGRWEEFCGNSAMRNLDRNLKTGAWVKSDLLKFLRLLVYIC